MRHRRCMLCGQTCNLQQRNSQYPTDCNLSGCKAVVCIQAAHTIPLLFSAYSIFLRFSAFVYFHLPSACLCLHTSVLYSWPLVFPFGLSFYLAHLSINSPRIFFLLLLNACLLLTCCLGKRGRRNSAGSLDSTIEVSPEI